MPLKRSTAPIALSLLLFWSLLLFPWGGRAQVLDFTTEIKRSREYKNIRNQCLKGTIWPNERVRTSYHPMFQRTARESFVSGVTTTLRDFMNTTNDVANFVISNAEEDQFGRAKLDFYTDLVKDYIQKIGRQGVHFGTRQRICFLTCITSKIIRYDMHADDEGKFRHNLRSACDSLALGTGICVNYSQIFMRLANRIGIPAMTALNTRGHAYNLVKVGDDYLAVEPQKDDCTLYLLDPPPGSTTHPRGVDDSTTPKEVSSEAEGRDRSEKSRNK